MKNQIKKIWETGKQNKYWTVLLVAAFFLGRITKPEPKIEETKVAIEDTTKSSEHTTVKAKEKLPDGTEREYEMTTDKFLENHWKYDYSKKIVSPEPEWVAGIKVSVELGRSYQTYGASLGYRVMPKTYLVGTIWPQEKRLEAGIERFF